MKLFTAFAIAVLLLAPIFAQAPPVRAQSSAQSTPYTARINEYPSLWQRNPAAKLPGNGSMCCGPVAASNALMWLVEHGGYRNLLPDPNTPTDSAGQKEAAHIALVRALISSPYVQIQEGRGSSARSVAQGVRRYIEDKGYQVERLEWRNISSNGEGTLTPSGSTTPQMAGGAFTVDEIKEALRGGAVVWLSVGLFRLVGDSADTFERYSGHAITLVGFGVDENGRTDPNILIVKDPDRRDDTWPNYYLRPVPLTHGFWPSRPGSAEPGITMAGKRYRLVPRVEPGNENMMLLEAATILKMRPASQTKP